MQNTNGVIAHGIEPRTEQEAVNAMIAPPVAIGYKPSPTTDIFWGDDETPYWRMVYDIPHMLLHPYVIIPYLWYKSGIANVEFEIKASSPDVEQFAHAELNNFWSRSLDQAQLVYDYGWLGCEASYHEVNGLMRYHSLHSFKPTDVWALTVKNRFRGVSVQNIQGDVPEQGAIEPAGAMRRGNAQLWGGGRWPGKGLWFVHHKQYDRFYGRSHLYGAWRPWRRLATRDGVEEVCDMAVYRFGVAGPILWYPPDTFKKAGGGVDYDAAREKSREFTEGAKAGASASFPNVRDKDGNKQWEVEWPEHTIEVAGLIAYMEKLEKGISCGIGVPPELLEASETGSGYSGRMVPMIGYYASQVKNARNFAQAFLWQSLLPLIRMNYGRDATCEVNVKLKLPTELTGQPPQGAGGPGAAPGAAPGAPSAAGAAPNALPGPSPAAPSPAGGLLPGPAAPSPAPGGAPPSSGPPEIPYSGPRGGKWLRNVKSGKLRHATMGTELSTLEYEDGEVEYELAAVHAPKGYSRQQPLVIAGRAFVGGEFIPADFLAAATPAQQQALGVTTQDQEGLQERPTAQLPGVGFSDKRGAGVEGSQAMQELARQYPTANPEGVDTFERQRGVDGKFTPQREALHAQIESKIRGNTPASQDKTYVALGGGPASGKSSIIHAGLVGLPAQHVLLDSDAIKGELPEYQALLQDKDARAAGYAHEESSYLAKKLQAHSFEAGQDVVLDGTGDNSLASVKKKCDEAHAAGYKVKAAYTTCSVEEAIRRNFERGKKTGRMPPESMVRAVHKGVSEVLPAAIKAGLFDSSALYDTEHPTDGKPTLVMSSKGTEATIHNPQLWQKFLEKGGQAQQQTAQPPPSADEQSYVQQAMTNLQRTSRTASGVVDTSASAGKAAKMAEGLTGDKAAGHATANFEGVVKRLYGERNASFQSPLKVQHLADEVNRGVNKGITKEGTLLRDDDSPKYPYTRVADLPAARQQFAEELSHRLSDPKADPVETSAWIEWRANMTDHFWADGVGKTALALAAVPLMRAGLPLPKREDPKAFFKYSQPKPYDPKQGGQAYLDDHWTRFLNYYRTLMPQQGGQASSTEPPPMKTIAPRQAVQMSTDVRGNVHLGKGPGGGEFTFKVRALASNFKGAMGRLLAPAKASASGAAPTVIDLKGASYDKHAASASSQLDSLGVRDVWGESLQHSPVLRSLALRDPQRFDRQMTHLEDRLRQASHFSGQDYPASSGMMREKLREVERLKADVESFRHKHMPEATFDVRLPIGPARNLSGKANGQMPTSRAGHYGRRGASEKNIHAALDHLAKGGDARSAVRHVMKYGSVEKATAQRYVRAAVKHAAQAAEDRIVELKGRLAHAG